MGIKVTGGSINKNKVSLNSQDSLTIRNGGNGPKTIGVVSSPKNRISIDKQDRTTIRSIGIAGRLTSEDAAKITAAYDQSNTSIDIAGSAYNYANNLVLNAATQLVTLTDVDATSLDNNETLVYDEQTGKFVVKELPIINGGTF